MTLATPNPPSQQKIILTILFYMITSTTMVMVNKWVLNAAEALPLTFLLFQLIIAVILIYASSLFGLYRLPPYRKDLTSRIFPLIACNVLVLAINTYCLKYVDASMYQVARSLVLPMTVVLTYYYLGKSSSPPLLASCSVVVSGFFLGMFGNPVHTAPKYPVLGPLSGLASSFGTAVHSIMIKSSLDIFEGSTMELVWWNNVYSVIGLIPLVVLTGELSAFSALLQEANPAALTTFIQGSIITGVFGFLINIAGTLQIQVTSPVTHMVSSAVRGVLQTILAMAIFGDQISANKALGITAILVGSAGYTWQRHRENSQQVLLTSMSSKK